MQQATCIAAATLLQQKLQGNERRHTPDACRSVGPAIEVVPSTQVFSRNHPSSSGVARIECEGGGGTRESKDLRVAVHKIHRCWRQEGRGTFASHQAKNRENIFRTTSV